MKHVTYTSIEGTSIGYWALLAVLGAIMGLAAISFYTMEHYGHYISGMNNQIVWGMPHVFAIFLIVAASGALNVASIASVFGKKIYKPLGRLSALLSLALLAGGLAVLLLDLGRPDRLIVAMTYYNFKSIFAWNIILYNGFFLIVGIYIWTMMERRMNKHTRIAGTAAFIWRLILTTGTGSIFGFLVARQGYDAAIMAPMFIVMSFSFGLAVFMLVLMALYSWTDRQLGDAVFNRLKNLLGVFVAAVLYFLLAFHLTNLYATEHHGVEAFILMNGGIFTQIFWIGAVVLGGLVPLTIFYSPMGQSRTMVALGAILVILGGFALVYTIVIGGQAYPLELFPGKEVISSSFYDGAFNSYTPSIYELGLGIGGIALTLAAVAFATKIMPFLPESLADADVDPHHKTA